MQVLAEEMGPEPRRQGGLTSGREHPVEGVIPDQTAILLECPTCGSQLFKVSWVLTPVTLDGSSLGEPRYGIECAGCRRFIFPSRTGPEPEFWRSGN
jgi:hypothetical protein